MYLVFLNSRFIFWYYYHFLSMICIHQSNLGSLEQLLWSVITGKIVLRNDLCSSPTLWTQMLCNVKTNNCDISQYTANFQLCQLCHFFFSLLLFFLCFQSACRFDRKQLLDTFWSCQCHTKQCYLFKICKMCQMEPSSHGNSYGGS